MDQQTLLLIGSVVIMLAMGGLAALIGILRWVSMSKGSTRVWDEMGYRPGEGGHSVGLGRSSAHFVRYYNGWDVHYLTLHKQAGLGRTQMVHTWVCPLPAPARCGLQVVERDIADTSLGARAAKAVSSYKYGWEQQYDQSVQTGDRGLDGRFAIFASDPEFARQLLLEPTVREALLSLKHVDLTLAGSQVRFDDPFMVNLWRKTGQGLADVHNRIAGIITWAASAARD